MDMVALAKAKDLENVKNKLDSFAPLHMLHDLREDIKVYAK